MKVVSFNINGIRARLHQLQALIDAHQPDVIGLQEIKVHDEQFPVKAVEDMGYEVFFHGQKSHYGVAFLAKKSPTAVIKGFPTDDEDAQRRMIILKTTDDAGDPVTILNGYFPQGENQKHETKYPAKKKYYQNLMTYLNDNHTPDEKVIVMGDVNVSHTDLDIGIGEENKKRWLRTGKCSFLPEEREWLNTLMSWGFEDSYRSLNPQRDDEYSWFDYRSKGFNDNRGLRIDLILATPSLHSALKDAGIDYELRGIEKPSDHAPIWATYE
ncbi:MAG: exodeoxyribonuclease III [Alteromonadaceae bacterium TMED7]|nr:exodeoxyribonuclease III [Alteromonadaceae bacterium]RPH17392.1 MAG: exodeoxyribonuclease III [Alteromonadaceae bacterium TMED7]|tara:strand:- start:17345 stop:18151 length:807 start_codon:yes stop_codon:yes gene_type:complete